jgi:magnesium-transporting ATPase (P-type)
VADVDAAPEAWAALESLAVAGLGCSTGRAVEREGRWVPLGDPLDAGLCAFARRLGLDPDAAEASRPSRRFPFDPERRRASVVAMEMTAFVVALLAAPVLLAADALHKRIRWRR